MKDREVLIRIYAKLVQHGESPSVEYMHQFRSIIRATPKEQETPVTPSDPNSLNQLELS